MILGIQGYIFSSNKLAENVGASKLVADIFDVMLPDAISRVTGEPRFEWTEHIDDALNDDVAAEIIYQGGGNAYVKFIDQAGKSANDVFQQVTQEFLTRVSSDARGVGVAVAAIETGFGQTYKADFEKLDERLALVKGNFNIPVFAGNQPITKQSGRTGLPVSHVSGLGEFMSADQKIKRERYAKHKEENNTDIEDFGDLVFEKRSDSMIAIVHADGNRIGAQIKAHMHELDSYEKAVPEIRRLSARIDKCYESAREGAIMALRAKYAEYLEEQNAKYPNREFNEKLPVLKLIGDGDDTTLVIGGRFAIDLAARLLRNIEATDAKNRP